MGLTAFKNVLIIGAGGHLGPSILTAFDSDPNFTVSILTRSSSASIFPAHLTVHRISDDYPEAELLKAFRGQDAIISTVATAVAAIKQKSFIDAAIKAGVKRFVPSEFGSDTRNEKAMSILPQYFKGKRETVEYLVGKEKEGLSWSVFVTGPFFELAVTAFMGFDIPSKSATIFGDGNDVWSTTTLAIIGLAVKNAMIVPEKTANQYIFIDSFTVSQNQVLAALEKATNTAWTATHVDAEKEKAIGLEKMGMGNFSGAMSLIRYINCVAGHGGDFMTYEKGAKALLELPKETLEEAIARVL